MRALVCLALLVVAALLTLSLPQASAGRRYKRKCDLAGCQRCYTSPSQGCYSQTCPLGHACDPDKCAAGYTYSEASGMCDCEENHGILLGRCSYTRYRRQSVAGYADFYAGFEGYNKKSIKLYKSKSKGYRPNSYGYRPGLYVSGPYCQLCPPGYGSPGGEPLTTFCVPEASLGTFRLVTQPSGEAVPFEVEVAFNVPGGCSSLTMLGVLVGSSPAHILCDAVKLGRDCRSTTTCEASQAGTFRLYAKVKGVAGIVTDTVEVVVPEDGSGTSPPPPPVASPPPPPIASPPPPPVSSPPPPPGTADITLKFIFSINFDDLAVEQRQPLADKMLVALNAGLANTGVSVVLRSITKGSLEALFAALRLNGPTDPYLQVVVQNLAASTQAGVDILQGLGISNTAGGTITVNDVQSLFQLAGVTFQPPPPSGVAGISLEIIVDVNPNDVADATAKFLVKELLAALRPPADATYLVVPLGITRQVALRYLFAFVGLSGPNDSRLPAISSRLDNMRRLVATYMQVSGVRNTNGGTVTIDNVATVLRNNGMPI